MSEHFNWRRYLRVHPAADKLPMMDEAELKELADDIKANGLRTGVAILGKKPDQPSTNLPVLIDGRNRLDAMAQAGLLAVNNQGHLCIRSSDEAGQGLRLIKYNYRDGDPDKLVLSLNIYRRHLTPERRRALIAALLKTDPTQSDRQIGRQIHADHKTIASDRAALETWGTVPHVETRTDTLGRQQRATKPPQRNPPRRFAGHDLDETEENAVSMELFKRRSWNGRKLHNDGIVKLYDGWHRGVPDERPRLGPLVVRLFKQLDRDEAGEVLDAIDQIYTNENVEGT